MTSTGRKAQFREGFLQTLNDFLHDFVKTSPRYLLKMTHSNGETAGRLERFFNKRGKGGTHVAHEYDSTGLISPFIGAIGDQMFGLDQGPILKVTSSYIDVVNFVYTRPMRAD